MKNEAMKVPVRIKNLCPIQRCLDAQQEDNDTHDTIVHKATKDGYERNITQSGFRGLE